MKTAEIDNSVVSASMIDNSMMTSDSEPSTEENITLGAIVTSVTDTITSSVSHAIDNVSKLSSTDAILLARSLSWGFESLAKSTEEMVFPRQAEEKMYKKQIKHMMAYQEMAQIQYYAAVETAIREESERMKREKEERKKKSVLNLAQDAFRRNKPAQSKQAPPPAYSAAQPDMIKSKPERKKIRSHLKAFNR